MAEENKIILDADVKPLKKQLREATLELQNARQKFGELSTEAVTAAQKVAGIRDSIEDANEQAQQFDPGKRFQALTTAASTAAGGIAAAQGALALFGGESKDVEKALLKVQGAMALSQGLSQLKDIGKVGDQLTTAFKGLTAGANGFKKALITTGIGALVVAVGLLVAYWDDILALVGGVSTEQKKLNEATKLDLQAQTDKLDAIDGQANQLKLQGKSEKEILDLKIAQTAEAIMAAEVNLANSIATKDAQVAAAKRNQEILAGVLKFVSFPLTAILGSIDLISSGLKQIGVLDEATTLLDDSTKYLASFVFDPVAVGEAGDATIKEAEGALNKLKEQSAGYTLSQQEADKAAGAKGSEEREKQRQKEAEDLAKANEEKLKMLEKQAEDEAAFEKQLNEIRTKTRLDGIKDENEKAREQILVEFEKQRQEILENDRLTSEQRTILGLELATQEQQALAAFQQTIDEANAIKELEKFDAQMLKDQSDFNNQKILLDQKLDLLEQFYRAGKISDDEYTAGVKANSDARKEIDTLEQQAKVQNAEIASQLLSTVSDIVGKNTAAGKATAIAATTIDTYLGAQKAYASQLIPGDPSSPIRAAIAAAIAVAGGIKNVRAIARTPVPGGGGASAPSISATAPGVAPAVPTIGNSPVTALGQMMQNQPPLRAYVVESEVTGTQKRVADIERRAGF